MNTTEINKLFEEILSTIKNSKKMVDLADKFVSEFGGFREDFLRGFAAKAMRKTYPELY